MALLYRVDFTKGPINKKVADGFAPDPNHNPLGLKNVTVKHPSKAFFDNGLVLSVYRSALNQSKNETVDNRAVVENLGFGPGGSRPGMLRFRVRITFEPLTGPMPEQAQPFTRVWATSTIMEDNAGVKLVAATFQTREDNETGDDNVRLNIPARDDTADDFLNISGQFWIPASPGNGLTWKGGTVALGGALDRNGTTGKTEFEATLDLPNPDPSFWARFFQPRIWKESGWWATENTFPLSGPPPVDRIGASIAIRKGVGTATVRLLRLEIRDYSIPRWIYEYSIPRGWWEWWRWIRFPLPPWRWWPLRGRAGNPRRRG